MAKPAVEETKLWRVEYRFRRPGQRTQRFFNMVRAPSYAEAVGKLAAEFGHNPNITFRETPS